MVIPCHTLEVQFDPTFPNFMKDISASHSSSLSIVLNKGPQIRSFDPPNVVAEPHAAPRAAHRPVSVPLPIRFCVIAHRNRWWPVSAETGAGRSSANGSVVREDSLPTSAVKRETPLVHQLLQPRGAKSPYLNLSPQSHRYYKDY